MLTDGLELLDQVEELFGAVLEGEQLSVEQVAEGRGLAPAQLKGNTKRNHIRV